MTIEIIDFHRPFILKASKCNERFKRCATMKDTYDFLS